jgi:uncharacterized spore protein YtfJ
MLIDEVLAQARDTLTVRRVFGEPIERDGLTVIPVANVMGGGGGGGGEGPVMPGEPGRDPHATDGAPDAPPVASGSGASFAVRATPAGAYVIKGGEVRWEPAVDLTRVIVMGQIVGIVFLLAMRSILRSRATG